MDDCWFKKKGGRLSAQTVPEHLIPTGFVLAISTMSGMDKSDEEDAWLSPLAAPGLSVSRRSDGVAVDAPRDNNGGDQALLQSCVLPGPPRVSRSLPGLYFPGFCHF